MGKGEIARYEQFLLFPQSFLPFWKSFFHFPQISNCRLQILFVWRRLKLVVWERVNCTCIEIAHVVRDQFSYIHLVRPSYNFDGRDMIKSNYLTRKVMTVIFWHRDVFQNERKVPQEPPDRIREITNTWPNFQDSPFYGPHKVKSMARVTLTKLKEHCGSDDSQQSLDDVIPSTEDLINMMKKKMMMTKKLGLFDLRPIYEHKKWFLYHSLERRKITEELTFSLSPTKDICTIEDKSSNSSKLSFVVCKYPTFLEVWFFVI